MIKYIFLDIDGVLNKHEVLESGYCGTNRECVSNFNKILDTFPELKIVISSAWRYLLLKNRMTIEGFEIMMFTHGLKCRNRIIGYTKEDGKLEDEPCHRDSDAWTKSALSFRKQQIYQYAAENNIPRNEFFVLDDLSLNMPELYQTDPSKGLTKENTDFIIKSIRKINGI